MFTLIYYWAKFLEDLGKKNFKPSGHTGTVYHELIVFTRLRSVITDQSGRRRVPPSPVAAGDPESAEILLEVGRRLVAGLENRVQVVL